MFRRNRDGLLQSAAAALRRRTPSVSGTGGGVGKPERSANLFTAIVCTRSRTYGIEYESRERNRYPMHLRGRRCRTLSLVFEECAAAFQFGPYFGYNLDALGECLSDFFLEGLQYQQDRTGLDVVIWDADCVLTEGSGERGVADLALFVSCLQFMADEIWERSGIVVGVEHVPRDVKIYLHFESEELAADVSRWSAAGCAPIARRVMDPLGMPAMDSIEVNEMLSSSPELGQLG